MEIRFLDVSTSSGIYLQYNKYLYIIILAESPVIPAAADKEENCDIFGSFSIIVQGVLALLSFLVLVSMLNNI